MDLRLTQPDRQAEIKEVATARLREHATCARSIRLPELHTVTSRTVVFQAWS